MMEEEAQIPGYWRFLWMFFMQPVSLHDTLEAAGIESPNAPGWRLWRQEGAARSYLGRVGAILGTVPLGFALGILGLLRFFGFTINLPMALVGVVGGVALSVAAGVVLGVSSAIVGGVAGGVAGGVVTGVAGGVKLIAAGGVVEVVAGNFVVGVVVGVIVGFVLDTFVVAYSIDSGVAEGSMVASGAIALGVVVGIVVGFVGGVAVGVAMGIAVVISAWIGTFRISIYILEVPLQGILYRCENPSRPWTLQFSPVLHHNMSYLPHPFLARHVLVAAEANPALALRVLDACAIAPGQRAIGQRVLIKLQARELEKAAQGLDFGPVIDLQGSWLPGREGSDPFLLGFAEAARYLASAKAASIPYHRLQKLERAQSELESLKNRLLGSGSLLARFLRAGPLPAWEKVVAELLRSAEAEASAQLPNPFRAKEPLSSEQGREVFRGREDLVHTIESLLGELGRGCSIALLGPRRTGKTSLLKMLPLLLPDAVCVFFDLQDNPIDSPAAFFSALARRVREQAKRDRQLELPDLPAGPPFESGSRWLESLDGLPGNLRILLCMDEFERLESLFPGSRQELLQLLGLIRATIQHRQRVRVLVAGAAPFEDLDALWNDHLINAREIRIGFLEREAAVGLLRKPIPEFPDEAIPPEVAERIFERTGGQPNLVQLYGSLLVTHLNEQDRRQADLGDVARVEEDVLTQETYYFRNILQEASPAARAALIDLAHNTTPNLDAATRRWLRRRLLLTEEGRLTMPVFGAWMRAEEGM